MVVKRHTSSSSAAALSLIILTTVFLVFSPSFLLVNAGFPAPRGGLIRVAEGLEIGRGGRLSQQKELVRTVGARLLQEVEEPLNIGFTVQEDMAVNAGATYGKIVVTTGMLEFVDSEDELAIVLGHEIAHASRGHISKNVLSNIALVIGSMLAEKAAPGMGGLARMGGSLFTQKFSRDMEREADYFGTLYAHRAGYDVSEGIEVWERFAVELPESQGTNIFSSHPGSIERLERARKIADTLQQSGRTKILIKEESTDIVKQEREDQKRPEVVVRRTPVRHDGPVRKTVEEVVAVKTSLVIHRPGCRLLDGTSPGDLIRFSSRGKALGSGGKPCNVCRP